MLILPKNTGAKITTYRRTEDRSCKKNAGEQSLRRQKWRKLRWISPLRLSDWLMLLGLITDEAPRFRSVTLPTMKPLYQRLLRSVTLTPMIIDTRCVGDWLMTPSDGVTCTLYLYEPMHPFFGGCLAAALGVRACLRARVLLGGATRQVRVT